MNIDEIVHYVRAKFSLLLIETIEEKRFVAEISDHLGKGGIKTTTWTESRGLGERGDAEVPKKALRHIQDYLKDQSHSPTAFILKDFQPYLKYPDVCRQLRDLSMDMVDQDCWIIVLSPRRKVPAELQDAITILEYDLPDREYLKNLVDMAVEELKDDEDCAYSLGDINSEEIADALAGLTEEQAANAISLSCIQTETIDLKAVLAEKARAVSESESVEIVECDAKLDNIAGYDPVIKYFRDVRAVLTSEEARAFGIRTPKGVLLVGGPGCGKSEICKALGDEFGIPVVRVDVGALFGGVVGETEENWRKLKKQLEAGAPLIAFFDEFDKAFRGAKGQSSGDSGVTSRLTGAMCTWLVDKTVPVYVVATANHPEHLPAEMIRKGRWDEIWAFDLPIAEGREAIFKVHIRKRDRDSDKFDAAKLAAESEGFSGAEIEACVEAGLYTAFRDGKRDLTTEDILQAVVNTVPLSQGAEDEIREMREWAQSRARNASGISKKEEMQPKSRFSGLRN